MIKTFAALTAGLACILALAAPTASAQEASPKTLRYAFRVAETSFDPASVNDLYSRIITAHVFEGLYGYDYLARPPKLIPVVADGMPDVSADFKRWTVKIKPGIYFQDDPAFKGRKRELVAADFVYATKRFADPKLKSPAWTTFEQYGIAGLAGLRKESMDQKKPFDYDKPIEGLQALDRYTVQYTLVNPKPRFAEALAGGDLLNGFAREVAEHYGDQIGAHPVGTGPFMLKQWRRSSLIVLERNPGYREVYYTGEPAADDAEGHALLARFKGRRLPMIDRVEVSIIEEEQPRWLSFLNNEHDMIELLPPEFIDRAMPNGKVAPNLAKRGIQGYSTLRADIALIQFNMESPVVGGYAPAQVALRRAISLGYSVDREIRLARHNQAIPANGPNNPHTVGFDPSFKSEMSDYNPAKARALLDMHGYVDKNGDGWRDMPDGSPLVLEMLTQPDGLTRKLDELREKDMKALGIRFKFITQKWPENLKASRAGNYMMWAVGSFAASPDGQTALARYHSKQIGGQNMARFKLPAFDALYERMDVIPHGPERAELFEQAKRMAVAYMPYKATVHRVVTDMAHPWLIGYRRATFWQEWWHLVDIDTQKLPPELRRKGS